MIATGDQRTQPAPQRAMSQHVGATVVEVPGSHAIYVSNPQAVADLIKAASKGAKGSTR